MMAASTPQASTATPSAPRPSWHGAQVLTSRAAQVLACFWVLLGLLYFSPGPLGEILRREVDPTLAPKSAVPTVSAPAPKPTPLGAGAASGSADSTSAGTKARHGAKGAGFSGQAIEDPRALASFGEALAALQRKARARVRVLHYGDSQIDLDHITFELRRRFQRRHGNGGQGFVPIAKPWRWYYLGGTHFRRSDGWRLHRLAGGAVPDRRLGVGLLAAEHKSGGWTQVVRKAPATRVELSYLRRPGGGGLALYVKGKAPQRRVTAAKDFALGILAVEGLRGKQQIVRVSTRGRVRLLGLRFERDRGLTWEGLPMISARFHQLAQVDGPLWRAQLKHLAPALVVYQFGANDALSYGGNLKRYQDRVTKVLRWRRAALPRGSCLIVGPLDQLRRRGGKLAPLPSVTHVIGAQRRAARAGGCAFWDARQAMGGPGSLRQWIARGMLRRDRVHLNKRGARELARLLDAALRHALTRARSPKGAKSAQPGRPASR
jgi:hypothetical protein